MAGAIVVFFAVWCWQLLRDVERMRAELGARVGALIALQGAQAEVEGVDPAGGDGYAALERSLEGLSRVAPSPAAERAAREGIAAARPHVRTMAAVCTGAFLLEAAGLLGDRPATTHWEDVALLAERRDGRGETRDDVRWVDTGDVLTAGGISSGIAMALHLVEQTGGRDLAEATARQIDYVWTETR